MKIEKKPAWKNNKCNECGDSIFKKQIEANIVYYCQPDYTTPLNAWKLCKKCFKTIFKEVKNES